MVMRNIDELHFASKCIIINEENKFLILKRTNYSNNGENQWDFPGGSVNQDECVNNSIKREANEELQIELIETEVFKINSGKGIPSGQFIFVLFASKKYNLKDGIKLSHEHSEYKWISLDEMNNYKFYLRDNIMDDVRNYIRKLR
jgi:8-oxo-dGTP pyrophosphatase MutT (NUDIX family)